MDQTKDVRKVGRWRTDRKQRQRERGRVMHAGRFQPVKSSYMFTVLKSIC